PQPPPPFPQPPGPIVMSPQVLAAILQLAMMLLNDLMAQHGGQPPLPVTPPAGCGSTPRAVPPLVPPIFGPTPAFPSSPFGNLLEQLLAAFLPAMQTNFENNILPQIEHIIAGQLASLNPTQPPK